MRSIHVALALASLWLGAQTAPAMSGPEDDAQAAAEAWLALVDFGNYTESWEEAATLFSRELATGRALPGAKQAFDECLKQLAAEQRAPSGAAGGG